MLVSDDEGEGECDLEAREAEPIRSALKTLLLETAEEECGAGDEVASL